MKVTLMHCSPAELESGICILKHFPDYFSYRIFREIYNYDEIQGDIFSYSKQTYNSGTFNTKKALGKIGVSNAFNYVSLSDEGILLLNSGIHGNLLLFPSQQN
jgi:hypothetical protein